MPAKPKPAFPLPAAVHPGEADLIAAALANLADDTAKLVYADWLDERADPRGPLLQQFVTAHRAGTKLPALKAAPKPWCDLLGLTLTAALRKTDLAPKTDGFLALARPTIAYTTAKAAEKALPVGASKFGGRPDLPSDVAWPRHGDEPLSFLGQFNLAELRPSPVARELPAAGVLSAFALYRGDGDDDFPDGSWRLFYFPDPAALARRDFDDDLEAVSRFPACRVTFADALTVPKWDSPWAAELEALGVGEYGEPFADVYFDLTPGAHLLGHPSPIQGDTLGSKDVRHLLTICGNEHTGWEFGDGGALYFTLSDADLTAGRFDRVKMHMDCG